MCLNPLNILYADDWLVAVNKPPGLLVHRTPVDKWEHRFCLQLLRNQLGRTVYPCHRLDKATSGIVLFALSREAHQAMQTVFSQGGVVKEYQALVRGWLTGTGTINHPLSYPKDYGPVRGGGDPQDAITHYFEEARYEVPIPSARHPTSRFTQVRLVPETGRIHQLRRHLKHLSHPIVGDTRYGDGLTNRRFREFFACHRLLLTACGLQFQHPFRKESIKLDLDPDWGIEF